MNRGEDHNRYLKLRGRRWWYERWVPMRFRHLDTRVVIRETLRTTSLEEARLRRDRLAIGHEAYWDGLLLAELDEDGNCDQRRAAVRKRFETARARALSAGFDYKPINDLVSKDSMVEEIVARVLAVKDIADPHGEPVAKAAEAILGGADVPKVTVSEALDLYINEISVSALMYKSAHQRYTWTKVKRTSANYFIERMGDVPIHDIDRDMALNYQKWWAAKVNPKDPKTKPIAANTANRHISNLRSMYTAYFKHLGDEGRANPFRGMHFKQKQMKEVPAFPTQWVREKVLAPGILLGINPELQLIVYMLVETGCRPSEVINLRPKDFHMNDEVPFISIRARATGAAKREVKTDTSERDVPLIGVAYEAAKRAAPRVFARYQDRNELFSANVLKAFRVRKLFPTPEHVIYSFRHSFEKRMQEANIDFALRCLLMGHKINRPAYGDGGGLAYRRDELLKIVHPFSSEIFAQFDAAHPEWVPRS